MNEIIVKKYIEETLLLKKRIESYFLELGERLRKIRDEQLYIGRYESFDEFLIDMDISKSTASQIISVFSFYSEKHKISSSKLAQVGYSKLYSLMKLTKDDASKKDVIFPRNFFRSASCIPFSNL